MRKLLLSAAATIFIASPELAADLAARTRKETKFNAAARGCEPDGIVDEVGDRFEQMVTVTAHDHMGPLKTERVMLSPTRRHDDSRPHRRGTQQQISLRPPVSQRAFELTGRGVALPLV